MIDLIKDNYKVLFILLLILLIIRIFWFVNSTFVMRSLKTIREELRTISFFKKQSIKIIIAVLRFISLPFIFVVLILLQAEYNWIDISNGENSLSLVISILMIYGILYTFIQFALGYANQKENDKYWGESTMGVLLNQDVEFSFFHSGFFKFILLYSAVFSLINMELFPFINDYQSIMLAFWEVCIAVIYFLYILLFTKSLFIMKRLFSLNKIPDFSTILFIERKKMEEYQNLFNHSIQNKKNLFTGALFNEVKALEGTEKQEMFKTILFDTLQSFKTMQTKMIRKHKKKKQDYLHFLYRKFTHFFEDKNLKEIDLSFDELLNIYRLTEKLLFNELKLLTNNDESKLVTEFVNLYSEQNNYPQECAYYTVPQIIWDQVDSNDDLFELHFYMENKDAHKIIQGMLKNEPNNKLNSLMVSQKKYIHKLLDQSKDYLEVFKNRKSLFVFNKNSNEFIKNNIYRYILNLEFTEENKTYIEVLINILDYKYKVSLVFFLMLYPNEDVFTKKQQDVLFLQRIMNKGSKDQKISDLEVKAFVLQEIGESNISHKIKPELVEEILKKLELDSTDIHFIQSWLEWPYSLYAKMLKLMFIFNGSYVSFPDFVALDNEAIKQKTDDSDWKIRFLKEMLRTPSLIKKEFFRKHITKISEEILKTTTADLYKENDFRLFYINPDFRLTEEQCWQILEKKGYLQDSIIEFLIMKLDESTYDYLFTNNRIAKKFKQGITEIIYQSNLNNESYVHDLADRANEVSMDTFVPLLKIEIIIRRLKALIY